MEAFMKYLRQRGGIVNDNIQKGKMPTAQQLEKFTEDTVIKFKELSKDAPLEVKQKITLPWAPFWDYEKNARNSKEFGVLGLLDILKEIKDDLSTAPVQGSHKESGKDGKRMWQRRFKGEMKGGGKGAMDEQSKGESKGGKRKVKGGAWDTDSKGNGGKGSASGNGWYTGTQAEAFMKYLRQRGGIVNDTIQKSKMQGGPRWIEDGITRDVWSKQQLRKFTEDTVVKFKELSKDAPLEVKQKIIKPWWPCWDYEKNFEILDCGILELQGILKEIKDDLSTAPVQGSHKESGKDSNGEMKGGGKGAMDEQSKGESKGSKGNGGKGSASGKGRYTGDKSGKSCKWCDLAPRILGSSTPRIN